MIATRKARWIALSVLLLPVHFDVWVVVRAWQDLMPYPEALVSFACHGAGSLMLAYLAFRHRRAKPVDYWKVTEWARVGLVVTLLAIIAASLGNNFPGTASGMNRWLESAIVPLIGIGTLLAAIGPAWSASAQIDTTRSWRAKR